MADTKGSEEVRRTLQEVNTSQSQVLELLREVRQLVSKPDPKPDYSPYQREDTVWPRILKDR